MIIFADTKSLIPPPEEKNWIDRYHESPECKTQLLCPHCKEYYLGWKLREQCRSCAHPKLPINGIRHITHSAVIIKGAVYALPGPSRHPDCWTAFRVLNKESTQGLNVLEGFLDNKGKYVNRQDAKRIAFKANQVLDIPSLRWHGLHSEDLW